MTKIRKKIYLVDGSNYVFRAYYAISPLSNSKGLPTNALYGFIRMISKLIKEESPEKLAIFFDTKEPTFRNELYVDYKANRSEPPEDLVPQFEYFPAIVETMGIKLFTNPGFEADDVIGTVAMQAEKDGYDVVIVTGDKDFMQLVGDHISLLDTMKERTIDRDAVKKRFGVPPEKVIDVMSLLGDSSDNIPGVPGIGEKSASKLINQFESLDNLLDNIEKVANTRARNALKMGIDNAYLSRKLVTIKLDVPLEYSWDEFDISGPNPDKLKELFSELEFFKLLNEMLPSSNLAEASTVEVGGYTNTDVWKTRVIVGKEGLVELSRQVADEKEIGVYFVGANLGLPLTGVAIATRAGFSAYIPLAHETLEEAPNISGEVISDFFSNINIKDKKILVFGIKPTLNDFKPAIDLISDNLQDIRLLSYVLNPAYSSELVELATEVLADYTLQGLDLRQKGKKKAPITIEGAAAFAGAAAEIIFKLYDKFSETIKGELKKVYKDMEMPLLAILYKMEKRGIKIDIPKLKELSKEYEGKIKKLEATIFLEAGETFAINSPKQLSHILFEKLELPSIKKTKTGYSTDAGVLTELAEKYGLPREILKYRSLTKLKSTYIDALPLLADADGRIHTTFNQTVTATGRLSSSDPNLQNIPIRTEEGLRIRSAFIAENGHKLMSADYSQIELRILADISKEPVLIQAFEDDIDVHSGTAANIFDVPVKDVDSKMRAAAKTVNFGVLYGQGAFGLSKQLEIDVGEADSYIKNYYKKYPRVKELKEKILKDASRFGYVETLLGRRRYIPDINSSNHQVRSFAERTAFNAVFQGTAADIIKIAMLEIDKDLSNDFPGVAMLLQVHDELVFEVPASKVEALSQLVRKKMCSAVKLAVKLEVDIGVGANWAECK